MAFVIYFIKDINLFLVIGIGGIVYFLVLYSIGGIKKEMIMKLLR